MKRKENSNTMIQILSKILIIIIALFILLVISVGLNIYFAYELSNYETTITYENEWELEENSNDKVEVVNGNQYYDDSTHNQEGDISYGER